MRMWGVNPTLLCNKHLLGEHVEMHMFEGAIRLGKSIEGYVDKGLVETGEIARRHDDLAWEMTARGMQHASQITQIQMAARGKVDVEANTNVLASRCPKCRERINAFKRGGNECRRP